MKKYMNISAYVLLLAIVGVFNSCKNKNFTEHIGPAICASDNFKYVQPFAISNTSIDLTATTENFSAQFNEDDPWTIMITGQTSHAYKKISGYGSSVDVNWVGNSDTLVFFVAEQCKVVFQVACKDPIIQYFNITTPGNFSNYGYFVFNGDGNGYNLTAGNGNYATFAVTTGLNSPQGGKCFCAHGSAPTPQWYFGGFTIPISTGTNVSTDPGKVYFNSFINVEGSQSTCPVVQIYEGGAIRSKNILVFGTGWHYVTFPLSDVGIVNPRNISNLVFSLGGYPDQALSGDMCIDFVTFTNDAPFINTPLANK